MPASIFSQDKMCAANFMDEMVESEVNRRC